jgi:hypothetical protein
MLVFESRLLVAAQISQRLGFLGDLFAQVTLVGPKVHGLKAE